MNNVFGDPQFWKDVKSNAVDLLPNSFVDRLSKFGQIPAQASDIAEQNFPNSARDASTKNAFRHALGTGMMAHELGGGQLGAAAAKGLGYLWEGFGVVDPDKMKSDWNTGDIKHDLNANALGAKASIGSSQVELINALRSMAQQSRVQQPPGPFEQSPGYLTRTVQ